jgi:hypothetical protein
MHTPPPESGRLPAATVADFDADVTGVREASPLAPLRTKEEPAPLVVEEPAAEAHARALETKKLAEEGASAEAAVVKSGLARSAAAAPELVAEATRGNLHASDAVAQTLGEAQRFAPTTFIALLDASLAL